MDHLAQINSKLKSLGFRKSNIREEILTILNQRPRRSADEILNELKVKKFDPNKTTVYRQLEFMTKQKVLLELDFGEGKKRYELNDNCHHHHLYCTSCHSSICVDLGDSLDRIESELMANNDFEIKSHHLEFFGICSNCQEKNHD